MNLKALHKAVCERDKYICQVCFKDFSYPFYFNEQGVNQYVCSDHILTRGSHPELTFEMSNNRTICYPCHLARHNGTAELPNDL